jgi:hypothetical protein
VQWVLEAEPSDGFVPWWWGLTLALLLLAAALLAVMLATAMIGNTQHQAMLYSLLPEEVRTIWGCMEDQMYVADDFVAGLGGREARQEGRGMVKDAFRRANSPLRSAALKALASCGCTSARIP